MHRSSSGTALALLAGTALALSACSVSTSSSPHSSASAGSPRAGTRAATTATTATATTAPSSQAQQNGSDAPAWGTGSQGEQAGKNSTLTVAEVKVGNHPEEAYSRLVVVFDGQGSPGWSPPQWDVPASTMGKGDPIEVHGDHTMIIRGSGVAGVPPNGQKAIGHQQVAPDNFATDSSSIDSAYIDPGFEGEFQVVVGTGSQTYRIFRLSNPTRLVIDIAHD